MNKTIRDYNRSRKEMEGELEPFSFSLTIRMDEIDFGLDVAKKAVAQAIVIHIKTNKWDNYKIKSITPEREDSKTVIWRVDLV